MTRLAILIAPAILLAGCASDPIVDLKGVDQAKYESDLADCRAYADQVDVGEQAGGGAVGGAVFGGLLGAIFGDSGSAGRGAGAGAVIGGGEAIGEASDRKERVLYRCLKGRGYNVLG